jgi:tripartite ATP-independent transporter DctP family solute receptor
LTAGYYHATIPLQIFDFQEDEMKRFRILFLLIVAGIVGQGGLFAGGGSQGDRDQAKKYTLRMSTQLADTNPLVDGLKEWAKNVEARTNGNVIIQVFPSAQLGSDEDVVEQAIQGANVAMISDGGRLANYVQSVGIVGMPYLVDSYEELAKLTSTSLFSQWEEELAKNGVRILSFWYDGARHFLTNVPVRKPADLKGQRIRTPGAAVWSKSVEAMGATPVAMPWNDTYNAMQTKAIDGCEAQHTASYGLRIYEVIKYINKTGHFIAPPIVVVSEKWYSQLPAEYQVILKEESKKAASENARLIESKIGEYEQMMIDNGMVIIEPDVAAFKAAVEPVYPLLGYDELRKQLYQEIGKK